MIRFWRNEFAILVLEPLRPEIVGCLLSIWVVVEGPCVGEHGSALRNVISLQGRVHCGLTGNRERDCGRNAQSLGDGGF